MVMILYLLYLTTLANGNFISLSQTPKTPDVSDICVFSADPAKYAPKCFVCRNDVYPMALQTCINGTSVMPKNISYAQAECMTGNCGINYPTVPPPAARKWENIFKYALEYLLKTRSKRALNGSQDNIEQHTIEDIANPAQGIIPDCNSNRVDDSDAIVDHVAGDLGDGKLRNVAGGSHDSNAVDVVMEHEERNIDDIADGVHGIIADRNSNRIVDRDAIVDHGAGGLGDGKLRNVVGGSHDSNAVDVVMEHEERNIDDIADRAHEIIADLNSNRAKNRDRGTNVVPVAGDKLGKSASGSYDGNAVDVVMEHEIPDDLQGCVFRVVEKIKTFASDMEDEEVEEDECTDCF